MTGPGGIGKTRVVVEAARALTHGFPGGVHVVYLARVATAVEVPGALVRAVKAAVQPGEREEDALVRRLGGAERLLVADNLEHVLDAAPLLGELVAACPGLHVLATSREPLRLLGEQCLPVAPLEVSDAVALFVDRAGSVGRTSGSATATRRWWRNSAAGSTDYRSRSSSRPVGSISSSRSSCSRGWRTCCRCWRAAHVTLRRGSARSGPRSSGASGYLITTSSRRFAGSPPSSAAPSSTPRWW